MALAERYCRENADELVFYDITASPEEHSVDRRWVTHVAAVLDIPFCVAGGIRSVYRNTGDPTKMAYAERDTLSWVKEAQLRGAGEIVLNCMNQDGVREGYDIDQLRQVRAQCRVPLIASGGAGRKHHFRDVFNDAGVDAALAASVFHSGEISVDDLKSYLSDAGIEVRT